MSRQLPCYQDPKLTWRNPLAVPRHLAFRDSPIGVANCDSNPAGGSVLRGKSMAAVEGRGGWIARSGARVLSAIIERPISRGRS